MIYARSAIVLHVIKQSIINISAAFPRSAQSSSIAIREGSRKLKGGEGQVAVCGTLYWIKSFNLHTD